MLENDRAGQGKNIHFKFELDRLSVNVKSTVPTFEELKNKNRKKGKKKKSEIVQKS